MVRKIYCLSLFEVTKNFLMIYFNGLPYVTDKDSRKQV